MSMALPPELLERLCLLAETLPHSVSRQVAAAIREATSTRDRETVVGRLLPQLNPDNRDLFSDFAGAWMRSPDGTSGAEVAAALDAAALQEHRLGDRSSVELVWTGPSALSAGLRSTEQVILQMIRSARQSIYLVTFAAYKIDSVATALRDAAARGVRVAFVLEDKDESAGKVSLSALPALSGAGLSAVKTYVWPLDQRQRNDRGDHGTLHAKCVLADSQRLFVSSANMTEFALTLNIELGVLLTGGDAPRQVERNLTELIRTGVLREFQAAA
jgi:phosphatidylserine/phosphatidylglycerophosphate/cardiolipin synthase-like enzyme